jgi:N utilization substance protein B
MSRREARERAFQLLFQLELQKDDQDEQIRTFLRDVTYAPQASGQAFPPEEYPQAAGRSVPSAEKAYLEAAVTYIKDNKESLDRLYQDFLVGWSLARLPIVDLCILRLAAYEITCLPDIPFNVSVSEAVLLTKKYADPSSRPYINAVLGRLKQFSCVKKGDEGKSTDE